MNLYIKKKKRTSTYLIILALIVLLLGSFWAYKKMMGWNLSEILLKSIQTNFATGENAEKKSEIIGLIPDLLGIGQPKTYLLLFENNTELRPGGGFIGSYAVVRVSNGEPEILAMEGTELLDRRTPDDWKPVPPRPITDHLGVDRWYFRDSNWSPDFSVSAEKALEFYVGEGGTASDQIDTVVAFTPTVLEGLLELLGPITVEDIEFTSGNVTEKLQYATGYGYSEKGLVFSERKEIMRSFFDVVLSKAKQKGIFAIDDYINLGIKMLDEKQIVIHSLDTDTQKKIIGINWDGEIDSVAGDYLVWVDANLAALKTDHAMERTLNYSIEKNSADQYVAKATMKYDHLGIFDWRTSRYRTYARIFVPDGSKFLGVVGSMKTDRSMELGTVDIGRELGKQWFGTFISIEPGTNGELSFSYILPDYIASQIDEGMYTLFVQKQLGTINHGLTLELNFDNNIASAEPSEVESEWGDGVYRLETDLRTDKEFEIQMSS
ncbi:DUF4012 domain-containing protein [Patescibacteria group bacterium]|nr:DUF4012 domain-containing protein [Patescibacteria group bacterium]